MCWEPLDGAILRIGQLVFFDDAIQESAPSTIHAECVMIGNPIPPNMIHTHSMAPNVLFHPRLLAVSRGVKVGQMGLLANIILAELYEVYLL